LPQVSRDEFRRRVAALDQKPVKAPRPASAPAIRRGFALAVLAGLLALSFSHYKGAGVSHPAVETARADSSKTVDSAFKLCFVFDRSRVGSKPCEVSGWHQTVTVWMDMTPIQARLFCAQLPSEMVPGGQLGAANLAFDPGWRLQINGTNGGPLASCDLR